MLHSQVLSWLQVFWQYSLLPQSTADAAVGAETSHVLPKLGQILRSKRVRIIAAATFSIAAAIVLFIRRPGVKVHFNEWNYVYPSEEPQGEDADKSIDWSRFAYTQYVTNGDYLCNSVMIFETLHRLGSKADRLMMYPAQMHPDLSSDTRESRLLLKAQNEYNVKLAPIQVQHRSGGDSTWADSYTKLLAFNQTQYDRVLSLDSDSTVLQAMDELFLLPPSPVAMPRAYWLDKPYLSSQLMLIQPSVEEFKRAKHAIDTATTGDFDMEIMNNLYGANCMVIPHRRYDLLTGEFRSKGNHSAYLGNDYEQWDPDEIFKEAKFLHFSDWPMPKPWLSASPGVINDVQPKCDTTSDGLEDCRARDMWLGFYADFKTRRESICDQKPAEKIARAVQLIPQSPWDFTPRSE